MPGQQARSGGGKYNAKRQKRAAKGSTLRNDDRALPIYIGLINLSMSGTPWTSLRVTTPLGKFSFLVFLILFSTVGWSDF